MALLWHASLHHRHINESFGSYNAARTAHTLSSFSLHSFLTRTGCEYLSVKTILDNSVPEFRNKSTTANYISCFCDDHPLLTFRNKESTLILRSNIQVSYSPWATSMLKGLGSSERKHVKEFTGGPTGGGKNGDNGDGDGGGDHDDWDDYIYILSLLTIAFATFYFGYSIAVWMKDESLNCDYVWIAVAFFSLLLLAALRLINQTGIDALILGLGASIGVMLCTGQRGWEKKEGLAAWVVTLFAAVMATMFSSALYETICWHM